MHTHQKALATFFFFQKIFFPGQPPTAGGVNIQYTVLYEVYCSRQAAQPCKDSSLEQHQDTNAQPSSKFQAMALGPRRVMTRAVWASSPSKTAAKWILAQSLGCAFSPPLALARVVHPHTGRPQPHFQLVLALQTQHNACLSRVSLPCGPARAMALGLIGLKGL